MYLNMAQGNRESSESDSGKGKTRNGRAFSTEIPYFLLGLLVKVFLPFCFFPILGYMPEILPED